MYCQPVNILPHTQFLNMTQVVLTSSDLKGSLPKVAEGKVRDLYEVDQDTLLFVASDRISAYDVIMKNVL